MTERTASRSGVHFPLFPWTCEFVKDVHQKLFVVPAGHERRHRLDYEGTDAELLYQEAEVCSSGRYPSAVSCSVRPGFNGTGDKQILHR